MGDEVRNVLVLCTGNSARSILGETLISHLGQGRFRGYSAGSFPKGRVHPGALAVLARNGVPADGVRSKSWDEFAGPDAPQIDLVLTVCDNAAGEMCPIFPGNAMKVHWGIEDPADAEPGDAEVAAFDKAYAEMHARVAAMMALDFEALDAVALKRELAAIGSLAGATQLAAGEGAQ